MRPLIRFSRTLPRRPHGIPSSSLNTTATVPWTASLRTPPPSAIGNWPYNIVVTTQWETPAETQANVAWTKEFWDPLKPFLADAAYVNYVNDEGEEGVRMSYGAKFDRLVALKTKYDPTNFFHVNQNIKPHTAASTTSP